MKMNFCLWHFDSYWCYKSSSLLIRKYFHLNRERKNLFAVFFELSIRDEFFAQQEAKAAVLTEIHRELESLSAKSIQLELSH